MSAKIIQTEQEFRAVKLEMTFETLEQLKVFFAIYSDPDYHVTERAFRFKHNIKEPVQVLRSAIDVETLRQLNMIIKQYK